MRVSRPRPTVATLVAAIAVVAAPTTTGCALVSGLSDLGRGACEGTCVDAAADGALGVTVDAAIADAGSAVDTSTDATADADAGPDPRAFCGGVACELPEHCCAPSDGGAPTCTATRCTDLLVECVDDRSCGGSGYVCCGDFYDERHAIGALTCHTSCPFYPLCSSTADDAGTCPSGRACRPTAASMPEVCTIP